VKRQNKSADDKFIHFTISLWTLTLRSVIAQGAFELCQTRGCSCLAGRGIDHIEGRQVVKFALPFRLFRLEPDASAFSSMNPTPADVVSTSAHGSL
jgi:hypothetical protein